MTNKYLDEMIAKEKELNLTSGQVKTLRAYLMTKNDEDYKEIIFESMPGLFESELDDVQKILHDACISTFMITDSSTALMSIVYYFLEKGWKVSTDIHDYSYGTKKALRFTK